MDRSPEPTERDQEMSESSNGPIGGGDDPDLLAGVGLRAGRSRRLTMAVAALFVLVPAGVAGWKWFQWTRTDTYQLQRVEAQASALLPQAEGFDAVDRWIVVTALAHGGDEAGIQASQIKNPYYQIRALSQIAATLAKAGADREAEAAGRELSEVARVLEGSVATLTNPEPRATTLAAIFVALARAGLTEPARAVARRANEEALQISDASTRSRSLLALALTFGEFGLIERSRSIILAIEDPEQRVSAMVELVTVLMRSGHLDQARTIARLAADNAAQVQDEHRRLAASNSAVDCLVQAGLADEALKIALCLKDPVQGGLGLHNLARSLLEKRLLDLARDTALHLKETAHENERAMGCWSTLRTAAEILARTGPIEQAQQAALEAQRMVFQIEVPPIDQVTCLARTASVLADTRQTKLAEETAQSARKIAQSIEDPGKQSQAWTTLVEPLTRMDAADQAEEAARLAEAAASQIADPNQRAEMLQRLVLALVENGLIATARGVAGRMPEPRQRHRAFSTIVVVAIDSGSIDQANELVKLAEEAAARIEQPANQFVALSQTAEALLRLDRPDEALRIARMNGNVGYRSAEIAEVAKILARKHRFRDARIVAESCEQPAHRLDAFATFLAESTKLSKPELAKLIDEVQTPATSPRRR